MGTNPQSGVFGDWDGSLAAARALQTVLAERVVLQDDFVEPKLLAGFDVGFEEQGTLTRAAVVLLDAATLQPLESHIARIETAMPYVPGLLSFRELPALLAALALLTRLPDLVFVDGQGIAHPRRLGIAAHFGVTTGLPALGVAKKVLAGHHQGPGPEPGDHTPLLHRGEQTGWAIRSKRRCNPLIVSPGHRVSLQTSLDWVMRTLRGYRLPEPTRQADRIASRRGNSTSAGPRRMATCFEGALGTPVTTVFAISLGYALPGSTSACIQDHQHLSHDCHHGHIGGLLRERSA